MLEAIRAVMLPEQGKEALVHIASLPLSAPVPAGNVARMLKL
jgi:hypothetical protein